MNKANSIGSFGKTTINKTSLENREGLVYCRVSSKRQETEGSGLISQGGRCVSELSKLNVPHLKTFSDSFSGGGDFMKRPALREMLEFIDANPYKKFIVVFDDISRFARDVFFHIKLKLEFKKRDVILKCLNYNFDESEEGEFAELIHAGKAELDRKQNRRKVIQKQKSRLELGYWAFASKKGYKQAKNPEHGTLSIPTLESKILKEVLEGFSLGRFQRKIDACKFLVEKEFWTKQKPEKYIDKFTKIARDCFYVGDIEYLQWEVSRRKGKHQGIIDIRTFNLNQKRLDNEGLGKRIRNDISNDFPLRSLIACENCFKALTGAWCKGRNKKYPYYFCQNKNCMSYGKSIKKEDVELNFNSFLKKKKLKVGFSKILNVIFEKAWAEEVSDYKKTVYTINGKITILEEKIYQLTDRLISAKTDVLQMAYESQIENAQKELNKLKKLGNMKTDLIVPYRTALEKANTLLRNPYKIWNKMDVIEKQRLFYFIFETKIVYSNKYGYRTAEKPYSITLFEEFANTNSSDVDREGIEPPTHGFSVHCSTN